MDTFFKIRCRQNEAFFLIGYALYVSATTFWVNVASSVSFFMKITGLSLLMVSAILNNLSFKKKILFFALYCLVSFLIIVMQFYIMFLLFTLFILASKNVDVKHLVKVDFLVRLTGFLLTVSCFYLGFAEDSTLSRFTEYGWQVRHSLGYVHPNACFFMAFVIACDFLYMAYSKLSLKHLFVIMLFVYFVQRQTLNRTGFFLIILLSLLLLLEKKFSFSKKKIAQTLLSNGFILCGAVSFALMKLYAAGTALGHMLNQLITMRLSGMTYYWQQYGLTILPQKVVKVSTIDAEATGERAYILDNLYFNFLTVTGVLYGVFFFLLYRFSTKNALLTNDSPLAIILFVFAVFGITEGITINIDYNYFLAVAASAAFLSKFVSKDKLCLR